MSDAREPGDEKVFCAMCDEESRGIDEAMNHVRLFHPDLWDPSMNDFSDVQIIDCTEDE